MNTKRTEPTGKQARSWGSNEDGTPYVVGMTVGELREHLAGFDDTTEVCMSVSRKAQWNGGGLPGKLKEIVQGVGPNLKKNRPAQIWLQGAVLDESLE